MEETIELRDDMMQTNFFADEPEELCSTQLNKIQYKYAKIPTPAGDAIRVSADKGVLEGYRIPSGGMCALEGQKLPGVFVAVKGTWAVVGYSGTDVATAVADQPFEFEKVMILVRQGTSKLSKAEAGAIAYMLSQQLPFSCVGNTELAEYRQAVGYIPKQWEAEALDIFSLAGFVAMPPEPVAQPEAAPTKRNYPVSFRIGEDVAKPFRMWKATYIEYCETIIREKGLDCFAAKVLNNEKFLGKKYPYFTLGTLNVPESVSTYRFGDALNAVTNFSADKYKELFEAMNEVFEEIQIEFEY